MGCAEDYVRAIGGHGDRYHAALAEKGEAYVGRVPAKDAGLGKWVKTHRPRRGECYMNAQRYVVMNPDTDWMYCEGFWAWSGGLWPLHHAWLIDGEGRVVDMTAEDCDKLAPDRVKPETDTYFGVEIPAWFVRERAWATKTWDVISDAWLRHLAEEGKRAA